MDTRPIKSEVHRHWATRKPFMSCIKHLLPRIQRNTCPWLDVSTRLFPKHLSYNPKHVYRLRAQRKNYLSSIWNEKISQIGKCFSPCSWDEWCKGVNTGHSTASIWKHHLAWGSCVLLFLVVLLQSNKLYVHRWPVIRGHAFLTVDGCKVSYRRTDQSPFSLSSRIRILMLMNI